MDFKIFIGYDYIIRDPLLSGRDEGTVEGTALSKSGLIDFLRAYQLPNDRLPCFVELDPCVCLTEKNTGVCQVLPIRIFNSSKFESKDFSKPESKKIPGMFRFLLMRDKNSIQTVGELKRLVECKNCSTSDFCQKKMASMDLKDEEPACLDKVYTTPCIRSLKNVGQPCFYQADGTYDNEFSGLIKYMDTLNIQIGNRVFGIQTR